MPDATSINGADLVVDRSSELGLDEAFDLFSRSTLPPCSVPRDVFDLYLFYELIPSREFQGRTVVRLVDLEAFLACHPSGVRRAPRSDDVPLTLRVAFDAYVQIDPSPISLPEFRELVRLGIIDGSYASDVPRAPLLGVSRMAVVSFLAARHRAREREQERHRHDAEREAIRVLSDKMTEMLRAKQTEKR